MMNGQRGQFGGITASELYCPTCKRAMPVREKLALYLPSGALYHYVCARCDAVLGKKQDVAPPLR
jgi:hypothetical protein